MGFWWRHQFTSYSPRNHVVFTWCVHWVQTDIIARRMAYKGPGKRQVDVDDPRRIAPTIARVPPPPTSQLVALIGSMSPWVLPERTLGTFRYTGPYPGNYLICRTVPSLLLTVPSFQHPHPTVGRKRTALRQYSLGLCPVQCMHARKCRKHYERKHAFPIIAIFAHISVYRLKFLLGFTVSYSNPTL